MIQFYLEFCAKIAKRPALKSIFFEEAK